MRRLIVCALLLGVAAMFVPVTPASAGDGVYNNGRSQKRARQYRKPRHAKRSPQVRGYAHHWSGDVCFDIPDPDERYLCQFAGFIDPQIDKQTPAGPFDSGFWFDSGMGRNGGDSPYLN